METEILNEYIFTSLIEPYVNGVRTKRIESMIADGVDCEIAYKSPRTAEDRKQAILMIESRRKEYLALLSEVRPDLSELLPGEK